MNPTELRIQKDLAQQAYEQEQNPVLKREHLKTFKHLNRQYRKCTQHRQPWHGVFRTGLRLVILLLLLFSGMFWIVRGQNWKFVTALVSVVIIGFGVVVATVLLIKRLINQTTYGNLLSSAFAAAAQIAPAGDPSSNSILANKDTAPSKSLPSSAHQPVTPLDLSHE